MPQLNRASLDKQRELNNLPPLTDEEFQLLQPTNGKEDKIEPEKTIDGKTGDDTDGADPKKIVPKKEDTHEEPKVRDLTEEELLRKVAEKTGRTIASWDDLKPAEETIDEETIRQQREEDKITWGLKNKVVKKKDYENYILDSRDAKDLVYRARLAEAQKEADFVQDDFDAEFEEEFGLDQKPESRRYKNGQNTLQRIAGDILKTSYAPIYSLEEKYSQWEQSQNQKVIFDRKIKEGAPVYQQTLDKVRVDLKKISTHFSDQEQYEVELLDESIDEVISMMSDPQWASQRILSGYTYEDLKDIAYTTVLKKNFPAIAKEIATQHLRKHAAGTKGIISRPLISAKDDEGIQLTEQAQKLKALIAESSAATTAN